MCGRVGDRNRRGEATGRSKYKRGQRKLVDDRFEILDQRIEREFRDFSVREAEPTVVVSHKGCDAGHSLVHASLFC